MKVYDCFLFFNEFDLLELRLLTLDSVVDHFVIVEAPWTFSGRPKPLHFKENYRRFRRWLKKIRHIEMSGGIDTDSAWDRESTSRNAMSAGFEDGDTDDLIFQSDLDEIWRPEKREEHLDLGGIAVYRQEMFYYCLNCRRVPEIKWNGTRRLRKRDWTTGRWVRDTSSLSAKIWDGGWHFSFLGDAEDAIRKMKAFSHTEYSDGHWTDHARVDAAIRSGRDLIVDGAAYLPIPIDETFPRPILDDPKRWMKYIRQPEEVH